jgi:GxxExxY protein
MEEENKIASIVLDEAFAIHSKYGSGLLESAYEKILMNRLGKVGLDVKSQVSVSIMDGDDIIKDAFRIDLLINDKVIIELKSIEGLPAVVLKQLKTYLVLSEKKLGLLINFGEQSLKNGIKRVIV